MAKQRRPTSARNGTKSSAASSSASAKSRSPVPVNSTTGVTANKRTRKKTAALAANTSSKQAVFFKSFFPSGKQLSSSAPKSATGTSSISESSISLATTRKRARKCGRAPICLTVPRTSRNNITELYQVQVDPKMRTLKFYEAVRPPYV